MRGAFVRTAAVIALATAWGGAGCTSQQDTIQQQREKLRSLAASTRLLTDDFLAGQVSTTYARTAFDAFFLQVEQQRSALAATPETLADPEGAALSQRAEQLSRTIAAMLQDVGRGDRDSLRARLSRLPVADTP